MQKKKKKKEPNEFGILLWSSGSDSMLPMQGAHDRPIVR